jgi:hypothetical protein
MVTLSSEPELREDTDSNYCSTPKNSFSCDGVLERQYLRDTSRAAVRLCSIYILELAFQPLPIILIHGARVERKAKNERAFSYWTLRLHFEVDVDLL